MPPPAEIAPPTPLLPHDASINLLYSFGSINVSGAKSYVYPYIF
jgi:hypothetical protein